MEGNPSENGMNIYNPKHLRDVFSELFTTKLFADITLVCDDNTQFKVHKFILNAFSSVFKNILANDVNQTCIVLRGISKEELEPILQYLYLGETSLNKSMVDEFIDAARDLDIREILNTYEVDPSDEIIITSQSEEILNSHDLDSKDESKIDSQSQFSNISSLFCQLCDYEASTFNTLKIHIKSQHANGFSCEQCNYHSESKSSLKQHIKVIHEKVRHPCTICDKSFSKSCNLKSHIQTVHEGLRYSCEKCDYQTKERQYLKRHVEVKHEGKRYSCKQCNYQVLSKLSLRMHVEFHHDGIKYSCNFCDYESARKYALKIHVQEHHEKHENKS